jgi:hypothetical protein
MGRRYACPLKKSLTLRARFRVLAILKFDYEKQKKQFGSSKSRLWFVGWNTRAKRRPGVRVRMRCI